MEPVPDENSALSGGETQPSQPPSAPTQAAAPPSTPRRAVRRYLTIVLILLGIGAAVWLAQGYRGRAAPAADVDDELALSVIGGWWNIVGDRHLTLEWEGHRATLVDYSASDAGMRSAGTWHATKDNVIVRVQGTGGELEQTLELVGNEAEMFLAPAPSTQARLFDSWIADHDDDAEDMSPPDSTAREARVEMKKTTHAKKV